MSVILKGLYLIRVLCGYLQIDSKSYEWSLLVKTVDRCPVIIGELRSLCFISSMLLFL